MNVVVDVLVFGACALMVVTVALVVVEVATHVAEARAYMAATRCRWWEAWGAVQVRRRDRRRS